MFRPCRQRERASVAACLDSALRHRDDAFAPSGRIIAFDGPMPMLRETDALNEAGTGRSLPGTARPADRDFGRRCYW